VKKVSQTQARNQKRAKKTKEAEVSLEAHVSTVSSDDVSDSFFPSFLSRTSTLTLFYFLPGFGEEIYHPGHGVCGVPKGCKSFRRYNFDIHLIPFFCIFSFPDFLSSAFAAALATANARIASLEAELKALQKAYDAATSAKAVAEKSQKSALAKAKKAEKALADVNKEHAQREQAVAERLHTMSTAAESKFVDLSSIFIPFALVYLLTLISSILFYCFRIHKGISVVPTNGR
jgi:hypothetical protein